MNWNRLLTAAVAVCCLVAVGTAATTMDSSVSTEPEEAVQFDYSMLPVGAQDGVGQLRRQVSTDDPSAASGGGVSNRASDGDGSHRESRPASKAKAADGGDPKQVSAAESGERRRSGGERKQEATRSLLERLLELLRALLAYLPAVLGLLVLGGAAYLLRDRLAGLLGGDEGRSADDRVTLGDPTPRNDVSRAWYEMVERVGLADRYDLTPDEHAERAAEKGVDPEAAASLTRLFEEVRYGDAPVTDERRRRARERVREIRTQARNLRAESGSDGR